MIRRVAVVVLAAGGATLTGVAINERASSAPSAPTVAASSPTPPRTAAPTTAAKPLTTAPARFAPAAPVGGWPVHAARLVAQGAAPPPPVRLEIPALGVDAPIEAVGVAPGAELAVPDGSTSVSWYRFGPVPGERGSAVLAAHVDFGGHAGVFAGLARLPVGARIVVVAASGHRYSFRAVARRSYRKARLPLDRVFATSGPPLLTLVTCGGRFDASVGHYDSNTVVYAAPA